MIKALGPRKTSPPVPSGERPPLPVPDRVTLSSAVNASPEVIGLGVLVADLNGGRPVKGASGQGAAAFLDRPGLGDQAAQLMDDLVAGGVARRFQQRLEPALPGALLARPHEVRVTFWSGREGGRGLVQPLQFGPLP